MTVNSQDKRIDWGQLLDDIQGQKCVLIIGPEIIEYNGNKTYFETLCEYIKSNDDRLHDLIDNRSFFNEELFRFSDKNEENYTFRAIKDFYKLYHNNYEKVFDEITQLPFHMILSLLPDNGLRDAHTEKEIPINYGYQPKASNPKAITDLPNAERPLIYNLLGDMYSREMVLSFHDLFKYLKGILGNNSLPTNLKTALSQAKSFLFLGVRFDKWYMQLLLKLLVEVEEDKQDDDYELLYAPDTKLNGSVRTFFSDHFALQFIDMSPQ